MLARDFYLSELNSCVYPSDVIYCWCIFCCWYLCLNFQWNLHAVLSTLLHATQFTEPYAKYFELIHIVILSSTAAATAAEATVAVLMNETQKMNVDILMVYHFVTLCTIHNSLSTQRKNAVGLFLYLFHFIDAKVYIISYTKEKPLYL